MALLSFPFFSHTVIQYVRKEIIRKEVKSRILLGIPDDQLVYFQFSHSETAEKLHWVEENEFEMGGRMYDVVRVHTSKDSIFFVCWPDEEESEIRKLWKEQCRQVISCDPQKQEHRKKVLEFEKSLFFVSVNDHQLYYNLEHLGPIFESPAALIGACPGQPEPPPRTSG